MNNILKHLTLMLVLISCTKKNDFESKNTSEIIPIISEYFVKKHPFNSTLNKDFEIDKFLINDKFIVCIDTEMSLLSNSVSLREFIDDYDELFSKLKNINKVITLDLDKSKFNNTFSVIELTDDHIKSINKTRRFKDFHLLLNFSRIAFNENYNKAILEISNSTSVLSGSNSLCFLKKINGKWEILGFQPISIY